MSHISIAVAVQDDQAGHVNPPSLPAGNDTMQLTLMIHLFIVNI